CRCGFEVLVQFARESRYSVFDKDEIMKLMLAVLALVIVFSLAVQSTGRPKTKGILLENLSWVEAEKILTPNSVVVIPLGAAAKEHGPHLKLKNDFVIAEYLKRRVLQQS